MRDKAYEHRPRVWITQICVLKLVGEEIGGIRLRLRCFGSLRCICESWPFDDKLDFVDRTKFDDSRLWISFRRLILRCMRFGLRTVIGFVHNYNLRPIMSDL